ncbi:MAG TPA: hypothetical protein VFE58_10205 [Tepidisphaeraceae bacterium]|jgi:hypothetical protein|nr:hypothetical protein [Tepidisphaeraceae bacterium]
MAMVSNILKGVIHGKTIELERDLGLPDGQAVSVALQANLSTGEGLHRAFGAWAGESFELDLFLESIRQDRTHERSELD